MGSMDKDLTLIKADVESSNDCVLTKPKLELFGLVDLISDIIFSLFDKKNFINLIQFNVNNFFLGENSWLK